MVVGECFVAAPMLDLVVMSYVSLRKRQAVTHSSATLVSAASKPLFAAAFCLTALRTLPTMSERFGRFVRAGFFVLRFAVATLPPITELQLPGRWPLVAVFA